MVTLKRFLWFGRCCFIVFYASAKMGNVQAHHVLVGTTPLVRTLPLHLLIHSALPGLPSVAISLDDNYSSRHRVGYMTISCVI